MSAGFSPLYDGKREYPQPTRVGCGLGCQPFERVARQPLPEAVNRELPITQSVWVGFNVLVKMPLLKI